MRNKNTLMFSLGGSYSNFGTPFEDRSLPTTPDKKSRQSYCSNYVILHEDQYTESDSEYGLEAEYNLMLPRLQQREEQFLNLVSLDYVETVIQYLQQHPELDINCVNYLGLSALHIAIDNKSQEMVEFLVSLNIDVGDCVLHAIREDLLSISRILLDKLKSTCPGLEFAGCLHSTDFPEYVTPLMLAAQCGHYDVVELLLQRGHRLQRPHAPSCRCTTCKLSLSHEDALQSSSARLALYAAISSPAYIVHAAPDPVLVAFRLSHELGLNAAACRQLSEEYLLLRDRVRTFAVDFVGCCRSTDEMELVMRQRAGSRSRRHFIFPRLLMAMDYRQKEFVAHPNTQQVLESYWVGGWTSWRRKSNVWKATIVATRVFITPFIFILCLILPCNRLLKHWQIPLNKLITHATAYFVFLTLVFLISNRDKTNQKQGPPDTGAELPLVLFVCGYTWSSIRMSIIQGPRRYFCTMWNWGEILMLSLFGVTFLLWAKAAVDSADQWERPNKERKYWNQYDPTLLAEGTFCVATIIAYFRLMFLCQLNYHLGPLQVSLGKMIIDIYKYVIVFSIVISAFAVGLSRLYQYYDGMIYTDESGMKTVQVSSFTSLSDTLNTLFWALFCMAPIESADVVLENVKTENSTDAEARHGYTEKIGYLCFACFEVISVIVVLNMLIATMSNTFQRVTNNVATEWTFGRTEVYVDYISQTTLPSPYNLVPTALGLISVMEWVRTYRKRGSGARAKCSADYCCYTEQDVEENRQKEFPALVSKLVQRYFRKKQVRMREAATGEREIAAMRRDICSLKNLLTRAK